MEHSPENAMCRVYVGDRREDRHDPRTAHNKARGFGSLADVRNERRSQRLRRHGFILAPLLAALPVALFAGPANAIDPMQTQVILPDQYQWRPALSSAPAQSVETVPVFGATDMPGPYVVLVKWYPGYMSAPHTYVTDRLCFVISGTWWVNSGENFEPEGTVPVPAGGFVRRVAHTPHYDGVKKGGREPAVIGIFGQAPIEFKLSDPTKPPVREV
jgi:hypothetical protein